MGPLKHTHHSHRPRPGSISLSPPLGLRNWHQTCPYNMANSSTLTFHPWRWRQQVPPEWQFLPTIVQGVTNWQIAIWTDHCLQFWLPCGSKTCSHTHRSRHLLGREAQWACEGGCHPWPMFAVPLAQPACQAHPDLVAAQLPVLQTPESMSSLSFRVSCTLKTKHYTSPACSKVI